MNPLTLLNSLPGALAQGLIWGIMAIGVAITYKILDYADLTVDNSLCTGGAVAAVCIIGGMNPLLALLCAVLAGALAGLCTGLLHTVLGIPAILSGILTQLALYSINMHIMGGKSNLTVSRTQYQLLLSSAKVPAAILVSGIFVIAIVALLYWFFGTQLGCAIRATGNNEHMARAQGISTNRMKVLGLMISNGLVGLSGLQQLDGVHAHFLHLQRDVPYEQHAGYADAQRQRQHDQHRNQRSFHITISPRPDRSPGTA